MSTHFLDLLTGFAGEIGLASVDQLLKTKEITIEDITISLLYEGDDQTGDVVLFSALGDIAPARTAEVLQFAMEANYLWAATGGATLGLSGNTMAMSLRVPLSLLNPRALASVISAFTQNASFWHLYTTGQLERASVSDKPQAVFTASNKA